MRGRFPLFSTPHDLCQRLWRDLLCKGDTVIDATMGGGKDSLVLAQTLQELGGGTLYSMDIQELALAKTKQLFSTAKTPLVNLHLLMSCHTTFPEEITSVKLIVYNLGYLPGGGNKELTTLSSTTLISIANALPILSPLGSISIMAYPGHEEGARENAAIGDTLTSLAKDRYLCSSHKILNRHLSPVLYLIQKL